MFIIIAMFRASLVTIFTVIFLASFGEFWRVLASFGEFWRVLASFLSFSVTE
jgi:hypothetical protein